MSNSGALIPFLILMAVVLGSTLYMFWYPGWQRKRLLAKPVPPSWLVSIHQALPFFDKMSDDEQQQLLDLVRLFIADKTFHGCAGIQISDEIRLTIAAEACLLLLNRHTGIYPDLKHILVYPSAFRAVHDTRNPDGTRSSTERGLLGESWQTGKVIVSWDDVVSDAANFHDGHNVVLHEFAHQLDSEDGSANGAPVMPVKRLQAWATVFSREFDELNDAADRHHHAVMDYYGATNPAEFFAVATETFFEKPREMEHKHPDLFAQLSRYYRVDPRQWHDLP